MMMNPCAEHSDINIYALYVNEDLEDCMFDFFLDIVDDERKQQVLRIKDKKKRDMKLLSRIFSMVCIKKEFGIDFKNQKFLAEENGKPYLAEHPDVHFNVSHSGELIVCAIGRKKVGIDVEKVREFNENLIFKVCNREERERILNSVDTNAEFCKVWTKKEAYLKYLGEGIKSFNFKNIVYPDNLIMRFCRYSNFIIIVCSEKN